MVPGGICRLTPSRMGRTPYAKRTLSACSNPHSRKRGASRRRIAEHVFVVAIEQVQHARDRLDAMAGSRTPSALSPSEIETLITDAGRQPIERDTLYNVVRVPTLAAAR